MADENQPKEVTIEEAISHVQEWADAGELDKAEKGIQEILEFAPDNQSAKDLLENIKQKKAGGETLQTATEEKAVFSMPEENLKTSDLESTEITPEEPTVEPMSEPEPQPVQEEESKPQPTQEEVLPEPVQEPQPIPIEQESEQLPPAPETTPELYTPETPQPEVAPKQSEETPQAEIAPINIEQEPTETTPEQPEETPTPETINPEQPLEIPNPEIASTETNPPEEIQLETTMPGLETMSPEEIQAATAQMPEAPKKSRKSLILLIILVLVISIGAYFAYSYFMKPEPEQFIKEPVIEEQEPTNPPEETMDTEVVDEMEKFVEMFEEPKAEEKVETKFIPKIKVKPVRK